MEEGVLYMKDEIKFKADVALELRKIFALGYSVLFVGRDVVWLSL